MMVYDPKTKKWTDLGKTDPKIPWKRMKRVGRGCVLVIPLPLPPPQRGSNRVRLGKV